MSIGSNTAHILSASCVIKESDSKPGSLFRLKITADKNSVICLSVKGASPNLIWLPIAIIFRLSIFQRESTVSGFLVFRFFSINSLQRLVTSVALCKHCSNIGSPFISINNDCMHVFNFKKNNAGFLTREPIT